MSMPEDKRKRTSSPPRETTRERGLERQTRKRETGERLPKNDSLEGGEALPNREKTVVASELSGQRPSPTHSSTMTSPSRAASTCCRTRRVPRDPSCRAPSAKSSRTPWGATFPPARRGGRWTPTSPNSSNPGAKPASRRRTTSTAKRSWYSRRRPVLTWSSR